MENESAGEKVQKYLKISSSRWGDRDELRFALDLSNTSRLKAQLLRKRASPRTRPFSSIYRGRLFPAIAFAALGDNDAVLFACEPLHACFFGGSGLDRLNLVLTLEFNGIAFRDAFESLWFVEIFDLDRVLVTLFRGIQVRSFDAGPSAFEGRDLGRRNGSRSLRIDSRED